MSLHPAWLRVWRWKRGLAGADYVPTVGDVLLAVWSDAV